MVQGWFFRILSWWHVEPSLMKDQCMVPCHLCGETGRKSKWAFKHQTSSPNSDDCWFLTDHWWIITDLPSIPKASPNLTLGEADEAMSQNSTWTLDAWASCIKHCTRLYGYGSIPIDTIISGMNIHKSQLFWGSPGVQGFDPSPYANMWYIHVHTWCTHVSCQDGCHVATFPAVTWEWYVMIGHGNVI